VRAAFSEVVLPRADLVHAGYSLPFSPARQFAGLWAGIRNALKSGGVFAGQLFGIRDSWFAGSPSMRGCHQRRPADAGPG
jgi:hypothetical protein